mgnify:CR=1 FL=1
MKNQIFTVKLAEKNKDKKFVLLGDGDNFDFISKYVKDKNLKNVFLPGKVNDVADYMSLFNYMLLPSKYGEGLPVVLIEQQIVNNNCICITSSNTSHESNIGNVYFVDINDINKWNDMLNSNIDTKKINNNDFDINNSAIKWIKFYD